MKKSLKVTLLLLCGIVAVLLAAVLVFVGIYFTRIQTMNSIEKLSDYDDGYNLYRMEVKYDYSLDDVINYGIKDNQTMIDAILKDALPLLPVKIEAPSFGCTAFTLTGAITISKTTPRRCSSTARRKTAIDLWPRRRWTMFPQTRRMRAPK